jgi:hypothetical protein
MKKETVPWFKPVLLLGGLIWIGRSALEISGPAYWNPVTTLDYIAVVGTSLQYLFLSAGLWGLYKLYPLSASGKQKIWTAGIVLAGIASAAAGVSNFVEDALGVKEISFVYGIGGFGTILGLLLTEVGALLHSSTRLRVGWFILASFVGLGFPDNYGGFVAGLAFWIMAWQENRQQRDK